MEHIFLWCLETQFICLRKKLNSCSLLAWNLQVNIEHAPLHHSLYSFHFCCEDICPSDIGRGLPTKTEKWLEIRGGPWRSFDRWGIWAKTSNLGAVHENWLILQLSRWTFYVYTDLYIIIFCHIFDSIWNHEMMDVEVTKSSMWVYLVPSYIVFGKKCFSLCVSELIARLGHCKFSTAPQSKHCLSKTRCGVQLSMRLLLAQDFHHKCHVHKCQRTVSFVYPHKALFVLVTSCQ